MTHVDLSTASTDELVDAYRTAAELHGAHSIDGDYESANHQAELVAAVYRELRDRGPEAQRALLRLIDDRNEGVRSWAGAHALEFAPERGESALAELAEGQSVAAFNAKMTLGEWRQGTLSFP